MVRCLITGWTGDWPQGICPISRSGAPSRSNETCYGKRHTATRPAWEIRHRNTPTRNQRPTPRLTTKTPAVLALLLFAKHLGFRLKPKAHRATLGLAVFDLDVISTVRDLNIQRPLPRVTLRRPAACFNAARQSACNSFLRIPLMKPIVSNLCPPSSIQFSNGNDATAVPVTTCLVINFRRLNIIQPFFYF